MSNTVIKVENLTKEYRLGTINHGTLYHDLQSWWARIRGKEDPNSLISANHSINNSDGDAHFLALKDVSFDVKQGEILGIIGRNGAGKSTLLKILSKVTAPTRGTVRIKGRVASLLEVGTGFHPELTGRENIFLNGAILGMTKTEIQKRFDEIVTFSEIEKFIDTPVKRYSSGMYVRLAFAVAAHLEPEILIVDEVLAVGDAQFQKKCLGKMKEVGKEGRTVLFVSHNIQAVQTLCDKSLLLVNGCIKSQGDVYTVVETYLSREIKNVTEHTWDDIETAPGNDVIKIRSARLIPETPGVDNIITVKTPFYIEFVFSIALPKAFFYLGFHFRTLYGEIVFVTASVPKMIQQGVYKSTCYIPGNLLNNGTYTEELYFVRDSNVVLYQVSDLLVFDVHDTEREHGSWLGEIPGTVRPKLKWDVEAVALSENV